MNKLTKLAKRCKSYKEFENSVFRWLAMYKLPRHWTKAHLKDFYMEAL